MVAPDPSLIDPSHLKCEAKELDKQCEQAKKVSGNYSLSVHALTTSRTMVSTRSEGKQLHAAMMCRKRKPSSDENQVEEEGYKLADTSTDVTGECANSHVSKRQRTDSHCH